MEAPAAAQEVPQDKHMEEFFQEVTAIKVKLWPARHTLWLQCLPVLCSHTHPGECLPCLQD